MIANFSRASVLALASIASTAGIASASSPYDGRWSLSIVTQRGACDAYNFPVDIANGHVTFPGLNKASGRVNAKGGVKVFVSRHGQVGIRLRTAFARLRRRPLDRPIGFRHLLGTWTAQRA